MIDYRTYDTLIISEDIIYSELEGKYNILYRLSDKKDIFLAEDENKQLRVIKIISTEMMNIEKLELIQSVEHKSISKILGYKILKDKIILIKEYIKGNSLYDLIEENGKVSENRAIEILINLIETLKYLHTSPSKLIFRDLHPKNIIINEEGIPILIDIETIREYNSHKELDTIQIGTIGFMAPEQYGFSQSDERSDIYSLGVILNYMITGKYPDIKNNSIQIDNTITNRKLIKIIKKMTAFSPNERYKNLDRISKDVKLLRQDSKYNRNKRKIVLIISMLLNTALIINKSYKRLYTINGRYLFYRKGSKKEGY